MAEQNLTAYLSIIEQLGQSLEEVKMVVELGARDCTETMAFVDSLPNAEVYAFECNPATLPLCRKAVAKSKRAHLVEKAVTDKDGSVTFFPIDQEKTDTIWEDGNPGASSLFKSSGKYPVETYVQNEIKVAATRLDTFAKKHKIKNVDLLWMDIQGAELMALRGAKQTLRNTKFVHTEVEFVDIYTGQALYGDIKKHMNKNGFRLYDFTNFGSFSADAVFVNTKQFGVSKRLNLLYRDKTRYFYYTQLPKVKQALHPLVKVRNFVYRHMQRLFAAVSGLAHSQHWYRRRQPILSIRRLFSYVYLVIKRKLGRDYSFNIALRSKTPIDVFIPAVDKDADVLPYTIESIRKNVKHPIQKIYIAAPYSAKKVKLVCKKLGCEFVDEAKIVPVKPTNIEYTVDGENRAGWLFQQLLKLNSDKVCTNDNILVVDADLVFTRPRIFIKGPKTLIAVSDFYHKPYYVTNQRLLGISKRYARSFVAHTMLFNSSVLRELRKDIEGRQGKKWYQAIIDAVDVREGSSFSKYELYGEYFIKSGYPRSIHYWNSCDMSIDDYKQLPQLVKKNKNTYTAIAFHNYNRG